MADGAPLPDLLLCWPFLSRELWICCEGFLSTKELQQTANVSIQGISKNKVKLNLDKLKKTKEDLVGKGEDYPLKTCIMEWVIL
jgi:hypothetical protein